MGGLDAFTLRPVRFFHAHRSSLSSKFIMPATTKYRSKNGLHDFEFTFKDLGSRFEVMCSSHPSLNGKDSNPRKTHLFRSGLVCFMSGKEPRTLARAKQLAAQWAEYFLEYRKTGRVQR